MGRSAFNSFTFTLAFGCGTCALVLAALVSDRWTTQEVTCGNGLVQLAYGVSGVYVQLHMGFSASQPGKWSEEADDDDDLSTARVWGRDVIPYSALSGHETWIWQNNAIDTQRARKCLVSRFNSTWSPWAVENGALDADGVAKDAETLQTHGAGAIGLCVTALLVSATLLLVLCLANAYPEAAPLARAARMLPLLWGLPATLLLAAALHTAALRPVLAPATLQVLFGPLPHPATATATAALPLPAADLHRHLDLLDAVALSPILLFLAVLAAAFTAHRSSITVAFLREKARQQQQQQQQQPQQMQTQPGQTQQQMPQGPGQMPQDQPLAGP